MHIRESACETASLYTKSLCNFSFTELGPNDTESARYTGTAGADIDLTGHMIKVDPAAICAGDDALRTENDTIEFFIIQLC